MNKDLFVLGSCSFYSRLLVGSGKYQSFEVFESALQASEAQIVTVALRRVKSTSSSFTKATLNMLQKAYTLLPNTAGCYSAEEAIRTAHVSRELVGSTWIKLEVIGSPVTLLPDHEETLKAATELVKEGFTVLPYVQDDPIVCKKLEDIGCSAIMPLAAPIGSGLGVQNPYTIEIIVKQSHVPVIIDAGVGTASDATYAMELGVDGILLNTAIAGAKDPIYMAHAMKFAVRAGRQAYLAGRIPKKLYASASSPLEGVMGSKH